MNISDIPMTAPTLVPVPRNIFRADLLEAAYYFLGTPTAKDDFELMVGDAMMRRQAVASNVAAFAENLRAAGALDPSERMAAQLQYAREIVAEGTMTPGRKLRMMDEVLNENTFGAEFVRTPEQPAPAPVPTFSLDTEPMDLLGEALQALQHMTLGQLRAHRISHTLLDRIEAVVVQG